MKTSVFFAHEDNNIREYVSKLLKKSGYAVKTTHDGEKLRGLTYSEMPDLIVTGTEFSDVSGFSMIKEIRNWSDVPIIVILLSNDDELKVKAFDIGADDCMVFPFSASEFVARVKNAMRHRRVLFFSRDTYSAEGLEIDFGKHSVSVDGTIIKLTPTEYKIVELLCRHSGEVLSYEYMLRQIWGPYVPSSNKILRVNMTNIRRKIEPDSDSPIYFHTENGIGYSIIKCE